MISIFLVPYRVDNLIRWSAKSFTNSLFSTYEQVSCTHSHWIGIVLTHTISHFVRWYTPPFQIRLSDGFGQVMWVIAGSMCAMNSEVCLWLRLFYAGSGTLPLLALHWRTSLYSPLGNARSNDINLWCVLLPLTLWKSVYFSVINFYLLFFSGLVRCRLLRHAVFLSLSASKWKEPSCLTRAVWRVWGVAPQMHALLDALCTERRLQTPQWKAYPT